MILVSMTSYFSLSIFVLSVFLSLLLSSFFLDGFSGSCFLSFLISSLLSFFRNSVLNGPQKIILSTTAPIRPKRRLMTVVLARCEIPVVNSTYFFCNPKSTPPPPSQVWWKNSRKSLMPSGSYRRTLQTAGWPRGAQVLAGLLCPK